LKVPRPRNFAPGKVLIRRVDAGDDWGGPIENRARLILEAVDGMVAAWSIERVGVRGTVDLALRNGGDNDPPDTFSYVWCANTTAGASAA
jgi:2,4-dienoyl-CoA reductase-like NADH-dependent reductase (Old Yellow Enzyme family)